MFVVKEKLDSAVGHLEKLKEVAQRKEAEAIAANETLDDQLTKLVGASSSEDEEEEEQKG